nr:hypothetical protein [Tanacetum cinerariifolium]
SRDVIFDKEQFTSIPRPRGMIQPSSSKIAKDEIEGIDDVPSLFVPRKTNRTRKAKSFRISTIRLLLALAAIHNLVIHQAKGFVMPGHESNLEYFRAIGCLMYAMISTRPDIAFVVRKLSSGYPSVIEGYSDASWINNMKDHSSTSAHNEAEWLRNLIYEIPLWPKPISTIFIRCDSVVTLAKAYSQVYNGKSRDLGVTHSMICELIMNGVISMEFVRTQLNLANHLTKGLAKDLVRKVAIGMGLKST